MEDIKQQFKKLYDYESWGQKIGTNGTRALMRPYSLFLKQEDVFQRVSQTVSPALWGDSKYTHREDLKKDGVLFRVTISPYYTDQSAKDGLLIRMIASIPFQEAAEMHIGDLCYTHPSNPDSYLLFLSHRTLVEILVPQGGNHIEDIKALALTIISQMENLTERQK